MNTCGGCRKTIKGGSLECSGCELWYDVRCSGATQSTIDFLNSPDGQKSSVAWYCKSCSSSTQRLLEMIKGVETRICRVESNLVDLKGVIDDLNKKIDSLNSPENTNVTPDQQSSGFLGWNTRSANSISEISSEIREREKRSLNVVFTGEVTKEKVESFVEQTGGEITKLQEIDTKTKKKLFITTLRSEAQKWTLIRRSRSISQSKVELNNIFANPDLTKIEREVQYHLRQELKRRRNLGENVKISRGRIVEVRN